MTTREESREALRDLTAAIVAEYKAAHPVREPGEISAKELAEKIGQPCKVADNWLIRQVAAKKYTKREVFYDGRFHTVYRKV